MVDSGLTLNQLIRLYSAADIFVLPTLEDVWGFVINEAMACGLPVVSTNAAQSAIEMITPGQNGYVVNKADEMALYGAIRKLIDSREKTQSMGQKSLEIIESRFDPALMKQGFVEAIKHATSVC
jgi:glycosyltransferase involved in cell wall biosynthesis